MKQPNFKRKAWKIGTLGDAQATAFSALALVARIRAAVGDPEGRLMQDDLIEHCRNLAQREKLLTEAKRLGDMIAPYAREHGSGMSEQLADEWEHLSRSFPSSPNIADEPRPSPTRKL